METNSRIAKARRRNAWTDRYLRAMGGAAGDVGVGAVGGEGGVGVSGVGGEGGVGSGAGGEAGAAGLGGEGGVSAAGTGGMAGAAGEGGSGAEGRVGGAGGVGGVAGTGGTGGGTLPCEGATPHGCYVPQAGNHPMCPPNTPEQSAFYPPMNEWTGCNGIMPSMPFGLDPAASCSYVGPNGQVATCLCDTGLHWLCTYPM